MCWAWGLLHLVCSHEAITCFKRNYKGEKNRLECGPACIRANTQVRRASIPTHEKHHQAFTLTGGGEGDSAWCLKVPKLSVHCKAFQLTTDRSEAYAGKGKNQKYRGAPSALSFIKAIYKYSTQLLGICCVLGDPKSLSVLRDCRSWTVNLLL